jgi:hypothetical protein
LACLDESRYPNFYVHKEYQMKHYAQQVRARLLTVIMAGVAGIGLASAATAAGVSAGANASVGSGAQAAGVTAEEHMSTSGSANSNAQWQDGATQGADRATDRTGTYGADMKQSGGAVVEATGKASVKGKR